MEVAAQGFIQPASENPCVWKEHRLFGPLFQCWWALEGAEVSPCILWEPFVSAPVTHPLGTCCCEEPDAVFSTISLAIPVAPNEFAPVNQHVSCLGAPKTRSNVLTGCSRSPARCWPLWCRGGQLACAGLVACWDPRWHGAGVPVPKPCTATGWGFHHKCSFFRLWWIVAEGGVELSLGRFGDQKTPKDLQSFLFVCLFFKHVLLIRCRIVAWWLLAVCHSRAWEKGDFFSQGCL